MDISGDESITMKELQQNLWGNITIQNKDSKNIYIKPFIEEI